MNENQRSIFDSFIAAAKAEGIDAILVDDSEVQLSRRDFKDAEIAALGAACTSAAPVRFFGRGSEETRQERMKSMREFARKQHFTPEQLAWNAAVDARKAEKKARKQNG